MRRARVLAAFLGLCLVAAACDDDGGVVSAPPLLSTASLSSFDTCPDVLGHIQAEALQRVTAWGLDGLSSHGRLPVTDFADGFPATTGVPANATTTTVRTRTTVPIVSGDLLPITDGSDDSGVEFSTTNVQVAGVDEPDVVKTDGSTLYAVRGRQLDVVDISSPDPRALGSFELNNWGSQILLHDGRVVVLNSDWNQLVDPFPTPSLAIDELSYGPVGGPTIEIAELDVSNPSAITVLRRARMEGSLVGARLVEGRLRAVVQHTPARLPFVRPNGPNTSAAIETNRSIIEQSSIDDWLPAGSVTVGSWTKEERAVDCADVHAPHQFSGFNQAIVFSLDLDDPRAEIQASAVLGEASMLYSTATSLYVATNEWIDPDLPAPMRRSIEDDYSTAIHAFATPTDGSVDYLGSGRVAGHALNQFSLDEHRGALRVVTTVGAPWSGGTESMVSVMRLMGDELQVFGSVGGLGKGERVQSVRFVGDRGYVVTFRQIDPLYTLDLTDDRNPKVLGELKIPGFSAYLHPIDENRLIGVGSDADLNGRVTGLLVSLFDVSDPTRPRQAASITVAEAQSSVSFDHRAFLYWPDTGLLVVPVTSWNSNFIGAMALEVDGNWLTEVGLVQHINPDNRFEFPQPIDRSLVANGSLITTSNLGIKTSNLDDVSDRGWLGLPLTNG